MNYFFHNRYNVSQKSYSCHLFSDKFLGIIINAVMIELVTIITIEWSVVAILYAWSENSINICRTTFMLYKSGVSVSGCCHVLRKVGINPIKSIETAITTEIVGSLVITHGIIPRSAIIKKWYLCV